MHEKCFGNEAIWKGNYQKVWIHALKMN